MSMELVGNMAVWLAQGVLCVFFFIMIVIIYLVIESIPEIRNEVRSELSTIIKEIIRAEKEELSNNSLENALEDTAEMSMAEKAEEKSATGSEESTRGALPNSQIQDPKTADIAGIAQYNPKLEEHYKIGVECLKRTEDAGSKAQLKHRGSKSQ